MSYSSVNGAVIYCRVSTAEQVEGFSLKLQERHCRDYCQTHGFSVLELYVDEGKSARTLDRPAFLNALHYCQQNREKVGYFIVYRLDRFSRSQVDHYSIKASLRKLGIRLISTTQEVDERQPESILIEGIAAAVGEYESRIIGLRAKCGMEEARRNGRLSNLAPIGYLNTRVKGLGNTVVPDKRLAPFVREAFRLYTKGLHSKVEIVEVLNEQGYLSHRGKQLSQQQLRKMLQNRTYAGYVYINDREGWTRGIFEPLVPLELFEAVQARLRRDRKAQSKPRFRVREEFPLRSFIRCSKCDHAITASLSRSKSGKRYGYYRCFQKGCRGLNVRREQLEERFIELLASLVPSEDFMKAFMSSARRIHSERREKLEERIRDYMKLRDSLRSRQQKLIDMFLDEKIGQAVFQKSHDLIQDDLQDVTQEIRRLTSSDMDLDNILARAAYCLENAANLWIAGDIKIRRVFQLALFPGGLTYDNLAGFGTPVSAEGFRLLALRDASREQVAGGQGFEPR